MSECSAATACPRGACPAGHTCYAGISCVGAEDAEPTDSAEDALAILGVSDYGDVPTPASVPETAASNPSPAEPASATEDTSSHPTTLWEGMFGNPATAKDPTPAPVGPVFERYCGSSLTNAMEQCSTAIACADGLSDNCSPGHTCFPIPEACDSFNVIGQSDSNSDPASAGVESSVPMSSNEAVQTPVQADKPATQPFITQPFTFNPNHTSFCGRGYADAVTNCYQNTPCPMGSMEECPLGHMCYTGITGCSLPPAPDSLGEAIDPPASAEPTPAPFLPDPSQTSFCGVDYNDAVDNCYKNRPCPNGPFCPDGQVCFPGIMNCQRPSAEVLAGIAMSADDAWDTPYPTQSPVKGPTTAQPTWPDFASGAMSRDAIGSDGPRTASIGMILKTLVAGGVIVGALLL